MFATQKERVHAMAKEKKLEETYSTVILLPLLMSTFISVLTISNLLHVKLAEACDEGSSDGKGCKLDDNSSQ